MTTPTFVESFQQQGFGVIRSALPANETRRLRSQLEILLPEHDSPEAAPLQRLVPRIVERQEQVAALATDTRLAGVLSEVFGTIPQLICSYGHDKPAGTDAHTDLHSDVSHLPGVPHDLSLLMVKVMLPLTPIRPGMGGTLIAPGSHRTRTGESLNDARYVTMEPGDLLLFHANIQHTATPNESNQRRLSIWLVYGLPWMRPFPGYEFTSEFIEQQRDRTRSDPVALSIFGLTDPYATKVV